MSPEACSFAAGLAVAISHPDWAILLQDERLNMESVSEIDDPDFRHSLGYKLNTDNKKYFIEDILTFLKEGSKSSKLKLDEAVQSYVQEKVVQLYVQRSGSDCPPDFYFLSNFLIKECLRPEVAEAIADAVSKCMMATASTESSNSSEDSDEDSNDEGDENSAYLKLKALIASQLDSFVIQNELNDVTTALQVSEVIQIGKRFFEDLLSDIPKLIDDCFDLTDSGHELSAERVEKLLIGKFAFPESLAQFLAVSMSKLVTQWANKPGMVLPRPMSFLEMGEYARRCVKEGACQEFKNNFGELIKSRDLLVRFNQEAEGRENIWHNYFYAYLDRLREALPPAKTAQ